MTIPIVIKGLKEGVNVGADFATAAGLLGLDAMPDPATTYFNLDALDEHNFPIEHDGSLSRWDAYFGNDHSFNQTIFNQILSHYEGMTHTSIPIGEQARYARIQNARAMNPKFIYGPRQLALSYGETALYMSVMGDPVTARAPIPYVKSFFGTSLVSLPSPFFYCYSRLTVSVCAEDERLPYELGWSKPLLETNFATLGVIIAQMELANPHAVPEGLSLGEGTYRDVFQLINPLTGKLENSTCIKAGTC